MGSSECVLLFEWNLFVVVTTNLKQFGYVDTSNIKASLRVRFGYTYKTTARQNNSNLHVDVFGGWVMGDRL